MLAVTTTGHAPARMVDSETRAEEGPDALGPPALCLGLRGGCDGAMGPTVSLRPGALAASAVRAPLVRVREGCSIREAAQAMRAGRVSAVVVGTQRAASSTRALTERDLALALASGLGPEDLIAQLATGDAVLVPSDLSVREVAAIMLRDQVTHVLVVKEGTVIGALSASDVVAVLVGSRDVPEGASAVAAGPSRPASGSDATSEIWLG